MERMSEIVEKLSNYRVFCTRSVKADLLCSMRRSMPVQLQIRRGVEVGSDLWRSNPPAQAALATASCPGLCPGGFAVSP